ncbi:hypothetical protein GCM10027521_45380 [Amycolatopsis cihanbeyliensis]
MLDIVLTSLAAYLHATALVGSAGVPAETFQPYAVEFMDTLSSSLTDSAREIDQRSYPGELANVTMMGATAGHILGAGEDAGIDLAPPTAVKGHYDRAIAAGHGRSGWTSLYEVIRTP